MTKPPTCLRPTSARGYIPSQRLHERVCWVLLLLGVYEPDNVKPSSQFLVAAASRVGGGTFTHRSMRRSTTLPPAASGVEIFQSRRKNPIVVVHQSSECTKKDCEGLARGKGRDRISSSRTRTKVRSQEGGREWAGLDGSRTNGLEEESKKEEESSEGQVLIGVASCHSLCHSLRVTHSRPFAHPNGETACLPTLEATFTGEQF